MICFIIIGFKGLEARYLHHLYLKKKECFEKHYRREDARRECPTNAGRRTEAGAGLGGDHPPQYRGGRREDMGRGGSRSSGRGGRDNQPPRTVRTLTPDRDVGLER